MYIVGFGGTWFDHPFWRAKFVLDSPRDLERVLKSSVPYVLIDEELGKPAAQETISVQSRKPEPARRRGGPKRPLYRPAIARDPKVVARNRASALANRSKNTMRRIFGDLREGWAVSRPALDGVVEDIVGEVEEDAKTLLSVIQLKTKDDYTYLHSVAVCALMVCFAKNRGMSEEEVREFGLAGLLHDIGKVGIPDPILNKPESLTDPEFAIVRNHPEHGHYLLSQAGGISATALDVCLHHHEKVDGTGYPRGLAGEEISLAARLGAVCDVFDALTPRRAYKQPWSPQKALGKMWGWKGHFDPEILFELMQFMHIYADGLLVRLSNGKLALTLEQNPTADYVSVAEVFCEQEGQWVTPRRIQIEEEDPDLSIVGVEDPEALGIEDWDSTKAKIAAQL